MDKLHGVVDTQTGINGTTRRIYIDGDVFTRICRIQVEQLCLERVRRIIVDGGTEEDDAVHHQTGEYVHLRYVERTLFKDIRIQVLVLALDYVVNHHGINTYIGLSKFSKIV
ncbi:hypothetical protein EVA_13805 [gut metagenome]|uniref:Uncharacterized protein n=1 Tax=gut metagenome TaxID=749906 RepID=J9G8K3_9ZZZZ